jgi:hypothetical protein
MVPSKNFAIVSLITIVAFGFLSFATDVNKVKANKGFAVVELFTSEGCSSCPPADALIEKIQKESNDQPVYILAFHVDYWDRLGWKDSFSSAAYSKRQNQYSQWLNAQVYTPQAVVNGSKEFVGSKEGAMRSAIKDQLQKGSSAGLELSDIKRDEGKITLQYHVQLKPANTSLLLALVEKNAVSKVLRGENGGRTLSHVQIVRNLQTIHLNGQNNGAGTLEIPAGLDGNGLEVIAFLQNNSNGEIIAATKSGI